jgi:hypothetical protein
MQSNVSDPERTNPVVVSRKLYMVASTLAVLFVCVVGLGWYISVGRAESRSSVVADALDSRSEESDIVATINDVPVHSADIDAARALLAVFPAQDLAPEDGQGILEYVIDQELLVQEAERRGLVVSEEDLTQFVLAVVRQIGSARDEGTLPADIEALIEGIEGAGHPLDAWATGGVMRDAYGRVLVLGLLTRDETGGIEDGPERDRLVREAMEQLTRELRGQAEIEYAAGP